MIAYKFGWKRGMEFHGRSTREEYFGFLLVNAFVVTILSRLDVTFGLFFWGSVGMLSTAYQLAVFIPLLALNARRLVDVNKPIGWIFINLIPVFGNIYYAYLMLSPSTEKAYYPTEKFWLEAQEKNRSEKVILFFLFSTAVSGLFHFIAPMMYVFNPYNENDAFRTEMHQAMDRAYLQQDVFLILVTFSLAFALKNKKSRSWAVVFATVLGVLQCYRMWNLLKY
jgi:uncharacterized membrane protein YhaH (DUF805 family)